MGPKYPKNTILNFGNRITDLDVTLDDASVAGAGAEGCAAPENEQFFLLQVIFIASKYPKIVSFEFGMKSLTLTSHKAMMLPSLVNVQTVSRHPKLGNSCH